MSVKSTDEIKQSDKKKTTHILDSTYKWYHTVFVFLFLTSLSMIISSCVHVAANDIILLNEPIYKTETDS